MGKAITYALNQKEYLMNYLTDGKAEISNNLLEMIKENGKSVDYDKLMPYSKEIPEHIRVK